MRTNVNIEELISKAAKAAAAEAIRENKQKEREEIKKNRFHNTELLLKNYNKFIAHIDNAIDSIEQVGEYYDVDTQDEALYIMSIRRTKYRTLIIIAHIDASLAKLELMQKEKYKVIESIYINGMTFEELAEEMHCSEMTVRRWKNEMIDELGVYLFDADGMRLAM